MTAKRTLIKPCQGCSKIYEIRVHEIDVIAWENGAHIQDVMPYLSASDRELLISEICGNCFEKLFETY